MADWKSRSTDVTKQYVPPTDSSDWKNRSALKDTPPVDEETGKLESFARGAEQGATFGFGDELNASLESLIYGKPYEQARAESRAAFHKAEQDNPMTSLAGNLGGAIAVPVPGAATTSVGRLALMGAAGGALAGLGTSEADLTKGEVGQAAKDVAGSAALGGGMGAGIGAISKGLGGASRAWKDTESAKNLSKMFNFARENPDFNTAANLEKTSKELSGAISDEYLPAIFNTGDTPSIQKAVSNQYEVAKKAAADQGQTLNFTQFRDKIRSQLDDVKIQDPNFVKGRNDIEGFLDALGQVSKKDNKEIIGRPELTPDVLDAASKKGQDIFSTFNLGNESTRANSDLAQVGLNIKKEASLSNLLDTPELEQASFMRDKFGDISANLGLNFKGMAGDELKQARLDAADKIKTMLMTSAKKIGTNGEMRFDDANTVAKELANSGLINGIDVAKTAEKLKNLAEKEFLMRTAQGESLLSSNTQQHLLIPFSAKAKGLQIASAIGKGAGAIDRSGITKVATNTMRYITADPEILTNLATRLEQSGSTFAPVLRNMVNQPEQKRKALMFSLMQQPAFRQAIKSDEGE